MSKAANVDGVTSEFYDFKKRYSPFLQGTKRYGDWRAPPVQNCKDVHDKINRAPRNANKLDKLITKCPPSANILCGYLNLNI